MVRMRDVRMWKSAGGPGGGIWSIWKWRQHGHTSVINEKSPHVVHAVRRDPVEALEEEENAVHERKGGGEVVPEDGEREEALGEEYPELLEEVLNG
jgi:hypothetical protein